ncbi:MAG: hypothetical protein AUJ48_01970 [Deltaproteobacteria bacterium CG1_02_45_11]|nr:MAG: hypothetical protein AUJ48_01970 [Deltaproteobacteria bacterium CG1_02_45_11]
MRTRCGPVNIRMCSAVLRGLPFIGVNGAGKSTFLKILSGEIEPDKGVASAGPGERIVVLQQDQFAYDEETAFNEGLMAFPEVILFASHDHQFVSTVANRIVELTPKGSIDRPMSFDDYLASAVVAKEREAHYCGERALAL